MTRRRALLIGITQYESDAIANLPIVARDLTVLQEALEASGFEVDVVGDDSDEGTSRSAILQRLRKICREARGAETLLLYFSGHGLHYNGQDYLIPADADVSDPDYLTDYLVPVELGPVADRCPARTILWVIDACREGVKLDAKAVSLSQWSRGDRRQASKRSLCLIFACGPGQYSQYVSGEEPATEGFSLFTRALAEVVHPQHPACQIGTVLQATQERLNELVAEHQKAPQEIRLAYESTAEDEVRSRIICEGELPQPPQSEQPPQPFVQSTPIGVPFQVPPLPSYYVDRVEARNHLKHALLTEADNTPGTLVVSAIYGLGGIGKSVLAAALARDPDVQARFPDGVLWATLGQQPEILAFLSNWIQALRDFDYKPTTIDAASAHLRSLLHEKRLLLVVDDAWSAEAVEPFRIGGSGCRVLVTTREARVPGAGRVNLEQMEPDEALALIEGYLQQQLTTMERQAVLQFAEAVGYLPLALELAAAQIQDGWDWPELLQDFEREVAQLEVLDAPDLDESTVERSRKQRSLSASFNLSLQRLKSTLLQQFEGMGVLPEDVSVGAAAMATIWQLSPGAAKRSLRELRRRSLLLDGLPLAGEPRYRMHDLMHDMARSRLQTSVGLLEAHRCVCDRYRAQADEWWQLPNDGYIHANLTWHLEKAGLPDVIHQLLRASTKTGTNAWFEACDRLGQPALFVQDIARAWHLAEALWQQEPKRAIILQMRYALMTTTLNSLAGNLPPELIVTLVKHNYWTVEQAWAYVEQMTEESHRAKAISTLVPHLPKYLLDEALTFIRTMQDECLRAFALSTFTQRIPELFNEALDLAQKHQGQYLSILALINLGKQDNTLFQKALLIQIDSAYQKALTLCKFLQEAPHIANDILVQAQGIQDRYCRALVLVALGKKQPDLLSEVLAEVNKIPSEEHRAMILSELVEKNPECSKDALSALGLLRNKYYRALTLSVLARKDPALLPRAIEAIHNILTFELKAEPFSNLIEHKPEFLHETIDAFKQIPEEPRRARVFRQLVDKIPEALLLKTLDLVRKIQDRFQLANSLTNIGASNLKIVQQALKVTRQIQSEADRTKALIALVPYLNSDLILQTLDVIQQIQSESVRSEALNSLIPYLPSELIPQVLTMAQQIQYMPDLVEILSNLAKLEPELWSQALVAAQQIQDALERTLILIELSSCIHSTLIPQILVAILRALQQIDYRFVSTEDLIGLASHLPPQIMPQVLTLWVQRIHAYKLAKVLVELASDLAEKPMFQVLETALAIMQQIQDESSRAEVLGRLAPHLPLELMPQALNAIEQIQDESERAEVLSSLAPHLPLELVPQALKATEQIQDKSELAKVLSRLVPHSPRKLVPQALNAIEQIQDESEFAKVLSRLVPHLPSALVPQTLKATEQIQDESERAEVLSSLAPHLPLELMSKALKAIEQIQDEFERTKVLDSLVPHLPPELIPEALTAIENIQYESGRAEVLSNLSPHLPLELMPQALQAVEQIQNESGRAEVLSNLSPHLPLELMPQALQAIEQITWQPKRKLALSSLIPHLSLELMPQALKAFQQFQDRSLVPINWEPDDESLQLIYWEPSNEEFWRNLVVYLSPDSLPLVLKAIKRIRDQSDRKKVLNSLTIHLSPQLLSKTLEVVENGLERKKILDSLALHLSPRLLSKTLVEAAAQIQDKFDRTTVLNSLLIQRQPNLMSQALELVRQIQDESDRATVLNSLAVHLSPELLPQAFAFVQQMQKESNRAEVLISLAQHKPNLMRQTLELLGQIQEESNRAEVLISLAPHLPPELLPLALEIMRRIQDESYCGQVWRGLAPQLPKLLAIIQTTHSATDISSLLNIPDNRIHQLWNIFLRDLAQRTRPSFLEALPELAPAIQQLGGDGAIEDIVVAMQEVCSQWP